MQGSMRKKVEVEKDKSRGEKEDMKEYEEKGKGGIVKSRGEKEDMKEYEEKGEKKKQTRGKGGSGVYRTVILSTEEVIYQNKED